MMLFFAIPPLTAVGTVVALATKDAYDKMTQSDDDQQ